jgi:hypothetical protein
LSNNKIALALVPGAAVVAVCLVSLRMHFQPPTVPSFAIADAMDGASLGHGDDFNLVIKPAVPLKGAIAARGFLLQDDKTLPWKPDFAIAADGTVRVSGPVDTLFKDVPPGAWDVAVVVGRPETLPAKPEDVLRARDQYELSWRLVRERIILRP